MEIIDISQPGSPITSYDSAAAAARELMAGMGPSHVHLVTFDPGGHVAAHRTGFGQLLVPLRGTGWVSGSDNTRHPLQVGQAAYFRRGEMHAKGSDDGMTAIMIQIHEADLIVAPP